MALHTSFLPNFPRQLQGKRKPSQASLMARGFDRLRLQALPDLEALLGKFFPENFFSTAPDSKAKRESIYTPVTVFWAFLFQVLNPDMACQGVVAKVRAWLIDRVGHPKRPSLGTAAYLLSGSFGAQYIVFKSGLRGLARQARAAGSRRLAVLWAQCDRAGWHQRLHARYG
jgi:hypothetical protein